MGRPISAKEVDEIFNGKTIGFNQFVDLILEERSEASLNSSMCESP